MKAKNNVTIKEIRSKYQKRGLYTGLLNDHFLRIFSPYCTKIFVNLNVTPNTVTMLMILFGIIGAILYALPFLYLKVAGIFFFYLWYLMDVSDGEVARATKIFSKYGKELDYTAHTIDHPFFVLSFMLNVIDTSVLFVFLIAALGLIDSMFRNLQSFGVIWSLKENAKSDVVEIKHTPIRFIKFLFISVSTFPLFVLVFPILLLINYYFAFCYMSVTIFASLVMTSIPMYRWIKQIY